jgi:glycosyltransferase involved in cell wall biosynthesis
MGLRRDALTVVLPFPPYLRESHDLWFALCGNQLRSIAHLANAVTARRYHDSNQTPERPRALPVVLRSRLLLLRLLLEARSRVRTRSAQNVGAATDATVVDVLIPYWGDPGYMKEAIDSVIAQTSPDWRLTVVDDAYPGTEIAEYLDALGDSRIRYVLLDENVGITENFRHCVSLATAELAVILGSDDRLLPTYVEKIQAAHAAFPEAAIIQPGVRVIDENGAEVRPLVDRVKTDLVRPHGGGYQLLGGEPLAANLLAGDWLYWPSLAFRTDRLKATPFSDDYPVTQDLALIMDMVFAGNQLLAFREPCFEYRRHSESASSLELVDGSRFEAEREYFAVAAEKARSLGWSRAVLAARARFTSRAHALTLMPRALLKGELRTALRLARHGFGS